MSCMGCKGAKISMFRISSVWQAYAKELSCPSTMEHFHMTSRQPYWCSKTKKYLVPKYPHQRKTGWDLGTRLPKQSNGYLVATSFPRVLSLALVSKTNLVGQGMWMLYKLLNNEAEVTFRTFFIQKRKVQRLLQSWYRTTCIVFL